MIYLFNIYIKKLYIYYRYYFLQKYFNYLKYFLYIYIKSQFSYDYQKFHHVEGGIILLNINKYMLYIYININKNSKNDKNIDIDLHIKYKNDTYDNNIIRYIHMVLKIIYSFIDIMILL